MVEHFHGKEGVAGSSPAPGFIPTPPASLAISRGPRAGAELPLDRELVIGRDPGADLVLDDSGVSRRHLSVRPEGGAIVAEDLGSSNGTLVNGHRITGPVELAEGDEIRLGDTVIAARRGLAPPLARRGLAPPPAASPVPRRLGPSPQEEGNVPALAAAFLGPLSIFLLVFSSGAAFFVSLPCAVGAVVLGTMGIRRAEADGSPGQRRLARAGRLTGIAGAILSVIALVAFLLVITLLDATTDSLGDIVNRVRDEIEGVDVPSAPDLPNAPQIPTTPDLPNPQDAPSGGSSAPQSP